MILIARALLLTLAAAAALAAFLIVPWHSRTDHTARTIYTCPMHPEVVAAAQGQCPICRMALEPARAQAALAKAPGDAVPERFTVLPVAQDRLFADIMGVRARPVSRAVLAPAWVESSGTVAANVYRDELALLSAREEATFGDGHGETPVRLSKDAAVDWDEGTVTVHLSAGRRLAAGTVGWVRFAPRTRPMIAVPLSALLQGPAGPYVLVASVDRHTFTKRPIKIGRALYGYAPVLSGLESGERVAVMETFFIDAERRLGGQGRRGAARAAP